MGTYAITGSASGMGHETAHRLRGQGHTVIGVDIKDADVTADLSTPHGRQEAAEAVLAASTGKLDGAVLAAGLGPSPSRDRPRQIAQVNYLGVVDLLDAWRPALAVAENAKVVVVASNSSTTVPAVPWRTVRALLAHDADRAVRSVKFFGKAAPIMMYAASKIAVSRWVRQQAVLPEWAGSGVRLNAIAPGAIMTPMLQEQLSTPAEAKASGHSRFRLVGSATSSIWPTGCASCYRILLTSSAAASFSSTAARTRISGPTTGLNRCRRIDCWAFSAGSEAVPARLTASQTCDEPVAAHGIVTHGTKRLFATFTKVRHTRKTAAVKFNKSAHRPNR